jgi:ligand-binding sensor domain-containing protein/signal transduction histidine kinase
VIARSLFGLLLFPALGFGQNLPVRTFTVLDGISGNDVRAIAQDSLGFLWIGSTDGLSRYDGVTFADIPLPGGLPANYVNAVLTDDSGAIWVATNFRGVTVLSDTGMFSADLAPGITGSALNRVNCIAIPQAGEVLLGTDAGVVRYSRGAAHPFHPDDPDLRGEVHAIERGPGGDLWIGGTFGLFRAAPDERSFVKRVGLPEGAEVAALLSDSGGAVWAATSVGAFLVPPGDRSGPGHDGLPHLLKGIGAHRVLALNRDAEGGLWFGTNTAGVFRLDADGMLSQYTTENGIPGNSVHAILQDREGIIWLATNAGLGHLASTRLVSYSLRGGLAGAYVGAITQDRQGWLWFGTPHGLSRLEGHRFSNFSVTAGLPGNYVLSLLTDRAGRLWVGTSEGLARRAQASTGHRFESVPSAAGPGGKAIRTIYQDAEGVVWFGHDRGIGALDRDRFRSFPPPSVFRSELVLAIVRDRYGFLWVGSQGDGLFLFDVGRNEKGDLVLREQARLTTEDGLSDSNIRALTTGSDGSLWVGTRFGGLNRIVHERGIVRSVTPLTQADGLSGGRVHFLMTDRHGVLWAATNEGVNRITRDSAGRYSVRTIDYRDGLAGKEGMCVFEDAHGNMWLGASNGVTRCDPVQEEPIGFAPPVYVLRCQVAGVDRPDIVENGAADLKYEEHSLSFEFIGLSFLEEQAVRYRYMLEGLDRDWSPLTERRYASYTHLPPGNYVFKVEARTGRRVWSRRAATIAFSIRTPYWQQWWFLAGVTAGIAGIIFGAHRMRVRHLLEVERVRSRIAADLHDDIGSTLSSISVFSTMAEEQLSRASHSAVHIVRRIGESARSVMESLDDIVWMVRPENDLLESMVHRIREYTVESCGAHGIAATVSAEVGVAGIQLPLDARRHVYLLVKEAVHNAVRHSKCTRIAVNMSVANGVLTVVVEDNGNGFDRRAIPVGDGLKNIERRAEMIGARLSFVAASGKGTTVRLEAPIA